MYTFVFQMATTGGLCCSGGGGSAEGTSPVTPAMIRKAIDSLEDVKVRVGRHFNLNLLDNELMSHFLLNFLNFYTLIMVMNDNLLHLCRISSRSA